MKYIDIEPAGKIYENLIKYAVYTSDAFMFFTCNYFDQIEGYNNYMDKYVEDIMHLNIKTTNNGLDVTSWPGSSSWENRFQRNFMYFKSDKSALNLLLKPKRLYNWIYPEHPEDISFFRNGYNWFATTAHEDSAYITGVEESEYKTLEEFGIVFYPEIFDDKRVAFYEEY